MLARLTPAVYLCRDVGVLNAILQVRHQHEVSSFVPAVVQRVVVDVTEYCPRPNAIRRVFCVDELAQTIHLHSRVLAVRLQYHVTVNHQTSQTGRCRFTTTTLGTCSICLQLRTSVKVLRPTRLKTDHFGDVLPSQSLGTALLKKQMRKRFRRDH